MFFKSINIYIVYVYLMYVYYYNTRKIKNIIKLKLLFEKQQK
jgi:hypothetical protein